VKGATNRTLFAWNDRPQKNRLEDGRLVHAVVSPLTFAPVFSRR
jgi:hypothetical protein